VNLYEGLMSVTRKLDESGVEYALVGGLAVAVWGAPRATQDIDLLVQAEQLEAALAAVEPLGFKLRALPMKFRDGMELQRVSKVEEGELLTLDFILVGSSLEPVWQSRQVVESEGGPLWVVSREKLIQMKVGAGRPQDLADVERLQEMDR